ncbi:MAG: anti-sigma factor [Actinomycetota bacterium]|nr:anti-sigma factor [Actinomycetota bacterium]
MSTDLHALSGAYALHALSPEEAHEFCEHFDACPACQQEVREMQAAAAQMGASEAVAPPAYLKMRVMSAVDMQSQLPPRVRQLVPKEDREVASGGRQERRPRWFPLLMAAAAAAVLIAVAGVGVSQLGDEPDSNLASEVTRVFSSDDASTKAISTSNGGKVRIATSPSLGEMAVDTDELPELSGDQVYQVWSITGSTTESAAVIKDSRTGAAMAMPSDDVEVAITIEPGGGSQQPTTEPIMSVVPSEI